MASGAFFFLRLNDHIQYLRKIQATLAGTGEFRGTDFHDCALGKWLYGEGAEQVAVLGPDAKAIFDSLFEPHQQFHDASKEAIELQERGDTSAASGAITRMMQLSLKLIQKLTKLDEVARV